MGEKSIKPIFKSGPVPGLRVLLLVTIAIVLMLFDHRSPTFHQFRNKLAVAIVPIQMLVNEPIRMVHTAITTITMQHDLLAQNEELKAKQLLLQARLQKLLVLQQENAQLKKLLQSTSHITGKVKVAQLMAVDLDPSLQQIVLDDGKDAQVYVGQPVLDAYGVMGQVIDIAPLTSKVLLITDTRSAVPVQDYRNGIRAVAVGTGVYGRLTLIHIPDTADIKVGDLFVTSGLGLHYPVGYPVGVVDQVVHAPGKHFATVTLQPSAHLDQTQRVLLVWPNKQSLMIAVRKELAKKVPELNYGT